MRELAFY